MLKGTLQAAAGTGSLKFSWADASQFEPFEPIPLDPEMGPALDFTAVPEPSIWALMLCGGLLCVLRGKLFFIGLTSYQNSRKKGVEQ